MKRGASSYRREGRIAGYIEGDPEKECPYTGHRVCWARKCWIEGFNEEVKLLKKYEEFENTEASPININDIAERFGEKDEQH